MVLLGDTPYIDSTVSIHQRIKHREFLSHEGQAYLSQRIPFWGTWDDHDFGANASDGRLHNRQSARQVFKEYRALTHYGENEEGIYNSFRRGPIEVFILDIRYFGATAPSFADASRPTLIGQRQWEWLKTKLKNSDAPFKILACGMSWTSKAVGPQTDSWERYAYEREAIIDFIGENRITGVVLVGGDIHCTQVMKLPTEDRIGYPLYHIVTSPMHNRVNTDHEKLDHPGMLFTRAEPNSFVKIAADTTIEPCLLEVDVINITGQSIFRLVTGDDLNVSVPP
jgi:alkaline phosphatase D